MSSICFQRFSGLPATSVGPMIRPSAAGHQRTLVPDGKSSPVAPQLSTLVLTWTTQVSAYTEKKKTIKLLLFTPKWTKSNSPTGGSGNFIYTLATGLQENEVSRLVSPPVNSQDADLCLSFWYHMYGPHIGTLHIKQRKQTEGGSADILLWTISGHQGNRWREGRVLMPRTSKPYQVSFLWIDFFPSKT